MELKEWIEKRFEGMTADWTEARIGEALAGIPELRTLALPHATEPDGHAYGRNVVFADDRMEAIVIHLPPHAATAVHDHGVSVGSAVVLEGRVANEIYRFGEDGKLRFAEEHAYEPGRCMPSPAGVVHRMRNDGPERLVSLHVYAPPLRGMKRYALEAEEMRDTGNPPVHSSR